VVWQILFAKQAQKDAKNIAKSGLRKNVEALLDVLAINPLQTPPPFEKLVGDLDGAYSRRINIQHRLVYQTLRKDKVVKIIRMWSHYGD
jgi:toxin YoeB